MCIVVVHVRTKVHVIIDDINQCPGVSWQGPEVRPPGGVTYPINYVSEFGHSPTRLLPPPPTNSPPPTPSLIYSPSNSTPNSLVHSPMDEFSRPLATYTSLENVFTPSLAEPLNQSRSHTGIQLLNHLITYLITYVLR